MRKKFFQILVVFMLFGVLFVSPRQVVVAAENESIDPMNVHPESGRWETTNVGFTATIEDEGLKCTDTGDDTTDYYKLVRPIRDMEGSIEVRFYLETTNTELIEAVNRYYILLKPAGGAAGLWFDVQGITASSGSTTLIKYNGDSLRSKTVTDVLPDVWYTFRLDYSIYESQCRFRLYDVDMVELWDYTWQDILDSDNVDLFKSDALELEIQTSQYSDTKVLTSYTGYVQASFDERNWRHVNSGSDAQWISDATWEAVRVEDDIESEYSNWRVNVPRLDRVTGIMVIHANDYTDFAAGDYVRMFFNIYCVDADDGDLHEALSFYLKMGYAGGVYYLEVKIEEDNVQSYYYQKTSTSDIGALQFIVGAKEDRTILVYESLFKWDSSDEDANEVMIGDVAVSSVAADPSHEFVFETYYGVDISSSGNPVNDDLVVDAFIDDFEVVSNFIFEALMIIGIGFLIGSILDATTGSAGIFQPFMDIFDGLLDGFGQLLQPVLTALDDFITDFFEWLFSVIGDFVDWVMSLLFWVVDSTIIGDIIAEFVVPLVDILGKVPDAIDDVLAYVDFWSAWLVVIMLLGVCLYGILKSHGDIAVFVTTTVELMFVDVNPLPHPFKFHVPFGLIFIPLLIFELGWSAV